MKIMSFQASLAAALVLAAAWLASPVSAQTQATPAAPVQSTAQPSPVGPAPVVAPPAAPQAAAPAAAKSDTAAGIAPAMKELSPWVMFMSADIIVKAVMIGLAFASLMTWTVLIAKSIELSIAATKLRSALKKIAEARSLAEAQMALGSKAGILPSFLAAALREARMSAGLSSDTGIKERAASSFSEIMRAEARRIRVGMGVLATIGSTSPFVGLFGTVWGIMNSFIGISKSQTTNLAVVAPGIAEALLATAIGLVAAIPAVIIYNYFSRVTKSYLELVSRASGAAGRLLSRDLDRSHGSVHSRAAE
ncbi:MULTISPECIES: tonB-system energizer ExbB [Bradyrhizobium]|jgi:biopolymer transport protein ExbB|uniref:tonB-system energizer ExbB n=1 Tax=Bradyrhizobium TaxID=374 RepID=UPI000A193A56|nr:MULTISPECIES: tonB-system energizer ExbB [Bradyrhizobium]MCK1323671.1 tonB-system energizer ExbB [Bradyrhizobium sp. 156]MCK1351139.1 tonB-system energizer ExbB [Bradyrhizobium sp. CW7]MCK1416132.1 tonB-system energizer ExbB [Bradyrhizobium sp. CW4]MCK1497601.1 tonB-system energizer ExbB [Bradyrhizobium sp. 188]MCK1574867.1 tonB-system energizer ExbB [Bradyrhizobium sp. 174]